MGNVHAWTILSYYETEILSYHNLWTYWLGTPRSYLLCPCCWVLCGTYRVYLQKEFQRSSKQKALKVKTHYNANELHTFNYMGPPLFIEN